MAHIDTSHPSPDGNGDGLAHIRFSSGLDALHRFALDEQCLQDAFPLLGRTGAIAGSQFTNAVVSYCGADRIQSALETPSAGAQLHMKNTLREISIHPRPPLRRVDNQTHT